MSKVSDEILMAFMEEMREDVKDIKNRVTKLETIIWILGVAVSLSITVGTLVAAFLALSPK